MANSVFLDTNGWLALLNSGDTRHVQVDGTWRELIRGGARIVLTDWIVAETGNGSAKSQRKHRVMEAIQATIQNSNVELIFIADAMLQRSLEFFGQHADKSWGLVDCASFLVMRDHGITDAFTSDKHFEQAGFRCLLSL